MSIQLLCISVATIVSLSITIILYNFTYLAPKFNLVLNGTITVFWFLGLALLSMSLSKTHVLVTSCTSSTWDGPLESGVCRDYKALWGMALVGSYVHISPPPLGTIRGARTNNQCH